MNNKLPAYKKPFSWLLFALIMASMNPLRAQEVKVVSDLQLWTGASLEKKLGKDWTLSLGEEIRFKHNISEINNYFSEAGLRFRITKNFGLEGGYRYTRDKKANSVYQNLSRYNLDLRYKGKLDFITIYYRLRYQKEVEGFNLFAQGIDYEKYLRNRIRIRYNEFKRIKPYVSAELFQLFTPDQPSDLDYIRLLLGVKYEPGDMGSFGLAYGLDRELSPVFPANIYQLKLSYTFQF